MGAMKLADFELFKSNICHWVKDNGDIPFIIDTLKSNKIREYFEQERFLEAFYLLAMVDYLSRENSLPLYSGYNDIRQHKLTETVYPEGILLTADIMKDPSIITQAEEEAIPEFKHFNIIESEIRNVI